MATKAAPKVDAESVAEEAPVKKSGKKMLLLIAVAVLLIGGGAGASWYFFSHKTEASGDKHVKVQPAKAPVFILMEPFTVNLQSEGTDQFLQCTFTLQVADNEQVELLKLYLPLVRSRLLLLLTSKHASDINNAAGKQKLIDDIKSTVNLPFTPGSKPQEVSDVFFTSFVIQ